jgi:NAD(P)-dependent dehydrogenase (short-subunit alcohol dehydrogenase family)
LPSILITGAGRGLGLELARQYAADGWNVTGTVRDASGEASVKKVGAGAVRLDVTDFQEVRNFSRRLRGAALDILFCNAGVIGKRGAALGSFDFSDWEKVFRVNVLGAAALAEALVDNVAASEKKTIALMSSRLGSIGESSGMTLPYSTTKAALNMLAKGLSATLAPRGIVVVALSPGWVRTDMGGDSAPLVPEASVKGLRKVLAGLRREDSGGFFAYDGARISW